MHEEHLPSSQHAAPPRVTDIGRAYQGLLQFTSIGEPARGSEASRQLHCQLIDRVIIDLLSIVGCLLRLLAGTEQYFVQEVGDGDLTGVDA